MGQPSERAHREVSEPQIPQALTELLEEFSFLDRNERIDFLIEYADQFENVPENIALRPYPEERRVKRCESQAYVWAEDNDNGTQKYYFAVENPQGISAKSFCAILDNTISDATLEEVLQISGDLVFDIYGREISMGKGEGLLGILTSVQAFARQASKQHQS